ncbi:MAG: beta strand repeat-containing protein, partial [Ignavibacteria bacterium]
MRKGFLVGLAATSALALPISNVEAQVPRFITFQGVLLDASNKPVADGSYEIRVHIYETAAGGAALYTENATAVTSGGAFSIVLGSGNPLPASVDFKAGYWAAVQVGNNPEMPRMKMTTTGYAFAADYAYNAANAANAANATFAATAGTAAPSGPAGGDLTGTYPNPEIKAGAVGAAEIADGSIEQRHFAANLAFPPAGPAGGDLTAFYPNPKIAVGAVKTVHIGDLQVIETKLATGAVSSRTILDGGIATVDIADGAVTTGKIADGTIAPIDLNTGTTAAGANELLMATGANSQVWVDGPTAAHQSLHWDGTSVSWRKLTPATFATETSAAANTTAGVGLNQLLMGTSTDNGAGGTQGWLNAPTSNRNVLRYNLATNSLQWSPNNALDFPIDETVNLATTMFRLTNTGAGTTGEFNNTSTGTALLAQNIVGTGLAFSATTGLNSPVTASITGGNIPPPPPLGGGSALDQTTLQVNHPGFAGTAVSVGVTNTGANSTARGIAVNSTTLGTGLTVVANPTNTSTVNNSAASITQSSRGAGVTITKDRNVADHLGNPALLVRVTGANNDAPGLSVEKAGTGNAIQTNNSIVASAGNISATAGSVSAGTTVTAGTGITSTTGNIVATAGQVNAGTTMTAGTGITSTTGNIVATAGQVNAGTTMTAGTGITST